MTFLCCHGHACTACDVHVICDAREIEHNIQQWLGSKFQKTKKNFGKKKTQLMSSLFSDFEGINILLPCTKESRTESLVNV